MKEVSLQSPTRREGVIMFALLICAYIIFATNYQIYQNKLQIIILMVRKYPL